MIVAETVEQAIDAARDMLSGNKFGAAGASVVIEEFMEGEEASLFALCDGEHVLPLVGVQDHKRAFDGDKGPNTGGMGAYSPVPILDQATFDRAMREIVLPTAKAMKDAGTPFQGVLYAGLMIGKDRRPRLVEYNCRFGDPECQVLMMRLKSDIVPALMACADGGLKHFDLRWSDEAALTVIMATKGYPDSYPRGSEIRGLDAAVEGRGRADLPCRHQVRRQHDILANGGRVLNVTAMAPTIAEARARAYSAVDLIDWPEGFCRRDIAWRAVVPAVVTAARGRGLDFQPCPIHPIYRSACWRSFAFPAARCRSPAPSRTSRPASSGCACRCPSSSTTSTCGWSRRRTAGPSSTPASIRRPRATCGRRFSASRSTASR